MLEVEDKLYMSTRYDRLLELSNFTKQDLLTLQSKKVLILGAGGVGQHVSTYLVTNGIENITILDFDKVEISNLNRQILLTEKDIGKYKVNVVKEALNAKNKDAHIEAINTKLDLSNVSEIITNKYDVVVDALDNWESKFIIFDECHKKYIPHLHVGVDGMSGQYCVFKDKSLRDILPIEVVKEKRDGVMGSVVGAISSMASTYLIQYLLGQTKPDELVGFDFSSNSVKVVKL